MSHVLFDGVETKPVLNVFFCFAPVKVKSAAPQGAFWAHRST
jgi:hypothetical protein